MDRKTFLKNSCSAGACACGFGALFAMPVKKNDILTEDEGELNLLKNFISHLLNSLNEHEDIDEIKAAVKQLAVLHYEHLNMDEMLAAYEGKPQEFITFIENTWGWKVDFDEVQNVIIANENKNYCVCPLLNLDMANASLICSCSEGFAEKMFGKVMQKKVSVSVVSSIHKGDKSCVYEIHVN